MLRRGHRSPTGMHRKINWNSGFRIAASATQPVKYISIIKQSLYLQNKARVTGRTLGFLSLCLLYNRQIQSNIQTLELGAWLLDCKEVARREQEMSILRFGQKAWFANIGLARKKSLIQERRDLWNVWANICTNETAQPLPTVRPIMNIIRSIRTYLKNR